MRRWVLWILMLVFCGLASAVEWREVPELGRVFDERGVSGTFVLYSAPEKTCIGYNRERAETRFIPASTFKIVNTLIGLSSGAVRNVDEVIPFTGAPQTVKAWEKDMSLREGIAMSNVPLYQELARRIGLDAMRDGVWKLQYGNCDIGQVVDVFWLKGPLEISAVEQCMLLYRLARRELPFPGEHQDSVAEIIELERGDGWVLYGKTGGATVYSPALGWLVGWVVKDGENYPFALNIDMPDFAGYLPKRLEVGKACLAALGLLPGR